MEAGCRPAHQGSGASSWTGRATSGLGEGSVSLSAARPARAQAAYASLGKGSSRSDGRGKGRGHPGAGPGPGAALPGRRVGFRLRERKCVALGCCSGGKRRGDPRRSTLGAALGPGQGLSALEGIGPQQPAWGSLATARGVRGVMARVGYLPVNRRNSSALSAGDSPSIIAKGSAIASDFAARGSGIAVFPEQS
jgi:hypothetical protein